MPLDGTDKIVPTAYDAHEQVVRNPHDYSQEKGYVPAPPAPVDQADGVAEEVQENVPVVEPVVPQVVDAATAQENA